MNTKIEIEKEKRTDEEFLSLLVIEKTLRLSTVDKFAKFGFLKECMMLTKKIAPHTQLFFWIVLMIHPQVHLRIPCYDFYFL